MIKHLRLKAYGKINLALDVLGRREDGYHEVRMIMQTVGLHDRIDLYATQEPGIRIETNLFYLPDNEQNLAHKAARLLMEEFGIRQGLSTGELMERGVTLGADIPYCLMRGTALSEGIGERLSPLPPMPQCQVLIAKPGISVSTKTVYESLDAMDLAPEDHPDIDGMVEAIRRRDLMDVAGKFGNVLELVTGEKYPIIDRIEGVMKDYGAINAMMSGSGPTVFGLFTNPKAAQDAYEALRFGKESELAKQVYLTNFFNVGRNS